MLGGVVGVFVVVFFCCMALSGKEKTRERADVCVPAPMEKI
jgi:hypothetical protein